MKAKKIIRYRIPVSVNFPATHPRKGEETGFIDKIYRAIQDILEEKNGRHALIETKVKYSMSGWWDLIPKRHTIRGNYALWAKRFEKIMAGEAVLELYHWSGRPYASKAVTICQLGKDDGIGIQQLDCSDDYLYTVRIDGKRHSFGDKMIAQNDGLSDYDFEHWFKGYDLSEPLAIIHFTPFRY